MSLKKQEKRVISYNQKYLQIVLKISRRNVPKTGPLKSPQQIYNKN